MIITPVDDNNTLFQVQNLVPDSLLEKINSTPWLDLPYTKLELQSTWPRRNISDQTLPWAEEFRNNANLVLNLIQQYTNTKFYPVYSTSWWVDEPGFTCAIHTDGELPASLQMYWVGDANLGTTFYHYKNTTKIRKQFTLIPNTGYLMVNLPDANGTQPLQWHGMLNPVPENTFRLTSYTHLNPVK